MACKIKNLLNEIDKVSTEYGLDIEQNTVLDLMVLLSKLNYEKQVDPQSDNESKERIDKDYKEAIEVIKANFPTSNHTLLCEALNLAIEVLEEKD